MFPISNRRNRSYESVNFVGLRFIVPTLQRGNDMSTLMPSHSSSIPLRKLNHLHHPHVLMG